MSNSRLVLTKFLPTIPFQSLAGSPQPILMSDGNNLVFPVYFDPTPKTRRIRIQMAGNASGSNPVQIDLYNQHTLGANVFTGDSVAAAGSGLYLLDFTMTWGYTDVFNATAAWVLGSGNILQVDGSTRVIAFYIPNSSSISNITIQPQISGSGNFFTDYVSITEEE